MPETKALPLYMSPSEAALHLGVNPRTIRRRIADGELPAYRIKKTRALRIRLEDLDALMQRIPAGGAK